ncbi:MAG: hypothetical protein ACI80P_000662 [Flavobacteriales bacterium]|jgi:hypothetical protein
MTLKQYNIRIAGSIQKMLLFFVFVFSASLASGFISLSNDTIVLDGKTVIVQREVTIDTVSTTIAHPLDEKKRKKRLDFGTWRGGFRAEGYVPIDILTSKEQGYSSVNAFVGADRRRGNGSGIMLFIERGVGKRGFSFNSGVGIDFITGTNFNFDINELNDSLLTFANFVPNQLDQILLLRYELGSEFDTLRVNLENNPFKTTWLRVPLGMLWEREINKDVTMRFGGGVNLRFLLANERPDVVFLPDLGKEIRAISSQDESWSYKTVSATPFLSGGVRFSMDRNWWLDLGLKGGFPFNPIHSNAAGVEYQSILLSGNAGVMYLFGK